MLLNIKFNAIVTQINFLNEIKNKLIIKIKELI